MGKPCIYGTATRTLFGGVVAHYVTIDSVIPSSNFRYATAANAARAAIARAKKYGGTVDLPPAL